MWILPKQLHTSAYVLDTKESGLDSEAFSQICEKSLTWRGKDSLSRTWLQRWKRENWMQHLCSRTLRPSLTESFVDAWTSSLEDSRVSHLVLLESVNQLKTQDTCFHTLKTESQNANPELFSLKTLQELSLPKRQTENQFCNMSADDWKSWITQQQQEYSQRVKLAHHTNGKESTYLAWPTATVSCAEGGRIKTQMTRKGFRSKRQKSNQYFGAKLSDAVETYDGLQDQTNSSTNGKNQESQGKLNPNWVEHLMGLPVGWTDLGSWETE